MLNRVKKFIPGFLLSWYHFTLAVIGAVLYRFPSKHLRVIGVTGTKGKTSTSYFIAQLLDKIGEKSGLTSTALFKIGPLIWQNDKKQTMLGRFGIQHLLRKMVNEKCTYAVVETSSEGILQHRHRGIRYLAAVFTNISPEHIERHGTFENYRKEKEKLFKKVSRVNKGISVINLDDASANIFSSYRAEKMLGVSFGSESSPSWFSGDVLRAKIEGEYPNQKLIIDGISGNLSILGEFNASNIALAVATLYGFGFKLPDIMTHIDELILPPGRLEEIEHDKGYKVFVDYAHEPASLKSALLAVRTITKGRVLVLTGAQGGGRDIWKRLVIGKVAAENADVIVITNEDPYDEDPEKIINDVAVGALEKGPEVHLITDRKHAIEKILALAEPGDSVLIAGKGGEVSMCTKEGTIPWSDADIASEFLK